MAKLTDTGRVVSSGPGLTGTARSWDRLDGWLRYRLPFLAARIKSARKG